jgi:hypothetical protein
MSTQTVKIICRNEVYTCNLPEPLPYRDPAALNWRYQIPGKSYDGSQKVTMCYSKPRIINWRWKSENN